MSSSEERSTREFRLSPERVARLDACAPVSIESAEVWAQIGQELSFDYTTVRAVPGKAWPTYFQAVPLAPSAFSESAPAGAAYLDIVFDGPPEHEAGRFVEVENADGAGVNVGTWVERPDGCWALRITVESLAAAVGAAPLSPIEREAAAKHEATGGAALLSWLKDDPVQQLIHAAQVAVEALRSGEHVADAERALALALEEFELADPSAGSSYDVAFDRAEAKLRENLNHALKEDPHALDDIASQLGGVRVAMGLLPPGPLTAALDASFATFSAILTLAVLERDRQKAGAA